MNNEIISRIGNHIIIDLIETWPSEILCTITKHELLLKRYLEFENRIDEATFTDESLRNGRPNNPYQSEWVEINSIIEEILKNKKFIGFHCTNLLRPEIDRLYEIGLKPLSHDFYISKLNRANETQCLSDTAYYFLLAKNISNKKNRIKRVFFCLSINHLKDKYGLYRFLGYWGGEATYWNNKDLDILNELSRIGIPTIVLGSLNYADLLIYSSSLACKLIYIYINKNVLRYTRYDADIYIDRKVDVLDTITVSDDLFEMLTNYSKWQLI